jgi:hypothetical protein
LLSRLEEEIRVGSLHVERCRDVVEIRSQ